MKFILTAAISFTLGASVTAVDLVDRATHDVNQAECKVSLASCVEDLEYLSNVTKRYGTTLQRAVNTAQECLDDCTDYARTLAVQIACSRDGGAW